MTLDSDSGEFSIYSDQISSVNNDGETWVTEITVEYSGYSVSGSVSGYLYYSLLHPCLATVGKVTF